MADICRVDTDALESAAGDIEKEKPALAGARTEVGGTTLPADAFGRVDQSGPAAQVHTETVKHVTQQLEAVSSEVTKLADHLRAWKTKYETDTKRAAECLINIGKGKPLAPSQR